VRTMKTLVITTEKGGVGKTALCTQFALYASLRLKKRVLILDFDSQNNASNALRRGAHTTVAPFTVYDVVTGRASDTPTAPLVLVPEGDRKTLDLAERPAEHNEFASNAIDYLDEAQAHFDLCIFDTNPAPDIRKTITLCCADYLLVPVQLSQEANEGLTDILYSPPYGYAHIKSQANRELHLLGLLPVLVEKGPIQTAAFRALSSDKVLATLLLKNAEGQIMGIPKRQSIQEAQELGVFIADMDKTSARDTWKLMLPTFMAIASALQLEA